eukprot:Em0005g1084a
MKRFTSPHFEILGAPIGDIIFCGKFVAQKRAEARHLLTQLEEVGSVDPQVALLLLRLCGSFCRLVHLARSTPPSLIVDGLALFDNDSTRHPFEFCQLACLGAQLEAGSSLGHEARQTRPVDVLIPNWELGKPAAIDLCVTSPLNSNTLQVACVTPNSAAMQAEQRKHHSNDAKCEELGWVCIPLVVESYGSWGPEAQRCLSRLAGRLATQLGQPKSLTTNLIYGRLNLTLIRANSRAILSRLYV